MLREAQRRQHLFRRFERVCADAMRLPFADSSVDVVFSSLMLQWCDPLDVTFAEIRRVLKPDGFFAFSTFGPDTLKELRAAWAEADGYNHVNQFVDMHDVGEALVRAGLVEPVLDVDRIQLTYTDTLGLMRDLKAIGAHNVTEGRSRGLMGRARLARMQAAYETYRRDGRLPATYEVIYGATWGAAGRAGAPAVGGEVRISPNAIRRPTRATDVPHVIVMSSGNGLNASPLHHRHRHRRRQNARVRFPGEGTGEARPARSRDEADRFGIGPHTARAAERGRDGANGRRRMSTLPTQP